MTDVDHADALETAEARALAGGPERHREKAAEQGKLPVRERVALLLDPGSFAEEGLLAGWEQDGLGAEGVVTGVGVATSRKKVPIDVATVSSKDFAPSVTTNVQQALDGQIVALPEVEPRSGRGPGE